MLTLAMLAAAALMLFATARPASAIGYDPAYRYCLTGHNVMYETADCSFHTLEQCRATAQGLGYCVENPVYRGGAAQKPRQRK